MREKLFYLMTDSKCPAFFLDNAQALALADYLIKNGVKIPTMCKNCKDYRPVIFNGEPTHYGFCVNTHDNVPLEILRHRYEGDSCSYGIPEESEVEK